MLQPPKNHPPGFLIGAWQAQGLQSSSNTDVYSYKATRASPRQNMVTNEAHPWWLLRKLLSHHHSLIIVLKLGEITTAGWWLGHPSEKYEFVNWDDEIPNISGKIQNSWQPNQQPDSKTWLKLHQILPSHVGLTKEIPKFITCARITCARDYLRSWALEIPKKYADCCLPKLEIII